MLIFFSVMAFVLLWLMQCKAGSKVRRLISFEWDDVCKDECWYAVVVKRLDSVMTLRGRAIHLHNLEGFPSLHVAGNQSEIEILVLVGSVHVRVCHLLWHIDYLHKRYQT